VRVATECASVGLRAWWTSGELARFFGDGLSLRQVAKRLRVPAMTLHGGLTVSKGDLAIAQMFYVVT
jgi:hypothetical protein